MRLVLPEPDGPPISACGGSSPSGTSISEPSVLSPIGAVRPCADVSAQKVAGERSASWAGGGPARIRSAVSLQNETTRSEGGGPSKEISKSPVISDSLRAVSIRTTDACEQSG